MSSIIRIRCIVPISCFFQELIYLKNSLALTGVVWIRIGIENAANG